MIHKRPVGTADLLLPIAFPQSDHFPDLRGDALCLYIQFHRFISLKP